MHAVSREEVEAEEERQAKSRGQPWLGHWHEALGRWEISAAALPAAVAYILAGLIDSG